MEPGKVDPRNESLKYAWERDKTTLFSKSDLRIPWDLTIASASLYRRRARSGPIAGEQT